MPPLSHTLSLRGDEERVKILTLSIVARPYMINIYHKLISTLFKRQQKPMEYKRMINHYTLHTIFSDININSQVNQHCFKKNLSQYYTEHLTIPENPPTAYSRLPMTATPTLARAVVMLGPGVHTFSCGQ
jgi:hypothetical protein